MLERDIEAYLVKRCKEIGALCDKFTSPQRRSVPDRLITFGGRVLFVELKATGKKPTEAQVRDHDRRRAAGALVYWLDSTQQVDQVISDLLAGRGVLRGENYEVGC
ncbi:VRR-NUC domain protein [compost metagenome]